jgi:protein TonB
VQEGKIRYFPAKAQAAGVTGTASLDCLVEEGGWLTDCRVMSEEPIGFDFGATALAMAPLFKMRAEQAGSRAVVPLHFKLPR